MNQRGSGYIASSFRKAVTTQTKILMTKIWFVPTGNTFYNRWSSLSSFSPSFCPSPHPPTPQTLISQVLAYFSGQQGPGLSVAYWTPIVFKVLTLKPQDETGEKLTGWDPLSSKSSGLRIQLCGMSNPGTTTYPLCAFRQTAHFRLPQFPCLQNENNKIVCLLN